MDDEWSFLPVRNINHWAFLADGTWRKLARVFNESLWSDDLVPRAEEPDEQTFSQGCATHKQFADSERLSLLGSLWRKNVAQRDAAGCRLDLSCDLHPKRFDDLELFPRILTRTCRGETILLRGLRGGNR